MGKEIPTMTNENIVFAPLTEDQLIVIKNFEREFNSKYDGHIFIMACGHK